MGSSPTAPPDPKAIPRRHNFGNLNNSVLWPEREQGMRLGLYRKGKDSEKSPRAAQLRQVFLFFRPASPPLRSGQKRAKKIDKEIGSLCLPLALRSPPPSFPSAGRPGSTARTLGRREKRVKGGGGGVSRQGRVGARAAVTLPLPCPLTPRPAAW